MLGFLRFRFQDIGFFPALVRVGIPRACSASWKTSSRERVYAPSSLGMRAKEQKTQVFRRTHTLVGLMC